MNSLLRARTVRGARGTAEALPLDRVKRLLQDYRVLPASRASGDSPGS